MKSLLKILTFLLFALITFSCIQRENDLSSIENQSLELEKFFEKVSSMNLKTSQENVIYIDYKWNPNTKTIAYLKSEEKEPDFFILGKPKEFS